MTRPENQKSVEIDDHVWSSMRDQRAGAEALACPIEVHWVAEGISREWMKGLGGCISPRSARKAESTLVLSGLLGLGDRLRVCSVVCLRVSKIVCLPLIFHLVP